MFNVYRARRSEARIQQMLWKVSYSDIISTVCVMLLLVTGYNVDVNEVIQNVIHMT